MSGQPPVIVLRAGLRRPRRGARARRHQLHARRGSLPRRRRTERGRQDHPASRPARTGPDRSGTHRGAGSPARCVGGRARQIGYVPQRHASRPRFPARVRDVVGMGRLAHGRPWRRPRRAGSRGGEQASSGSASTIAPTGRWARSPAGSSAACCSPRPSARASGCCSSTSRRSGSTCRPSRSSTRCSRDCSASSA